MKKQLLTPDQKMIIQKNGDDYLIHPAGLYRMLHDNGFRNYNMKQVSKAEATVLVQVIENIVECVNQDDIARFCRNYISGIESPKYREALSNSFLKNSSNLLSKVNLATLEMLDDNFIRDTRDNAYLFFRNGAFVVHADRIERCSYQDLRGYVWKSQIIQADLKLAEDELTLSGEYEQFCRDITTVKEDESDNDRFNSLRSVIGYLLHQYKNPTITKAVILMDSRVSDTPCGGSGKGLLISALARMKKVATEDGKIFSATKPFGFSQISYDTAILVIDDVQKNFDFEKLFVAVTEGFLVELKYANKVFIPADRSPKIVVTTNYVVGGTGFSHERRKLEFELSDYYGPNRTPQTKFGHLLFDEWNAMEWNRFYLFMIDCLHHFLKEGLVEAQPINIKQRRLLQEIPDQVLDFFDDNIVIEKQYEKAIMFAAFQGHNRHYPISRRKFATYLQKYAEILGRNLEESHSGNQRFFWLA